MHREGLAGRPRHYAEVTGSTSSLGALLPAERGVTYAAFFLGAAQLLFLANLLWSFYRGRVAGRNPWSATTLEWSPLLPGAGVTRGPYDYGAGGDGKDFFSQCEAIQEEE
jgi:cytochrome c oxidase subunit 1